MRQSYPPVSSTSARSDAESTLLQGDGRASMSAPLQPQPEHVTATATFLGLVYPGRGLEQSVRKEHIDNMTAADYVKVWKVWRCLRRASLSAFFCAAHTERTSDCNHIAGAGVRQLSLQGRMPFIANSDGSAPCVDMTETGHPLSEVVPCRTMLVS